MIGLVIALVGILAPAQPEGLPDPKLQPPRVAIVVRSDCPERNLTGEQVAAIFLKDIKEWSDGAPITPVDQSLASRVRLHFTAEVFGQPVSFVRAYWESMMSASGSATKPPRVLESDGATLAYVAATPGAIGYVSPSALLPPGLVAVKLR